MGLFSRLVAPRAEIDVTDERYWSGVAPISVSGLRVTAETAMRVSTVWACVRLIAESMASMPLLVYRRRADGGRERATGHPLYDLLHTQPNRWQNAFDFVEMMTGHVLLRGNAYALIVPGARGSVDQLVPVHPDRVMVEQLENGALRYRVLQANGSTKTYMDDEIFHLRGLSSDGLVGLSVIDYARDSIGLAMATESHGARHFAQNATVSAVLEHPGKLKREDRQKARAEWQADMGGLNNAYSVAVLPDGMKYTKIGLSNEDSQFLETREFQVADVARWFRVPLHMIQDTSPSTSWGSGLEQMQLAFVMFTLLPWARRWEQAIMRDLIIASDTYYAEFLLDTLVRGDQESRNRAYATGRQWGWLSVNDVRQRENMNPVDGGDVYLQPSNMVDAGDPPDDDEMDRQTDLPTQQPGPEQEAAAMAAGAEKMHYRLLLHEAAGRVVRKEVAALQRAAKRCNGDAAAWEREVLAFYGEHAPYVAETLAMCETAAKLWTEQRGFYLISKGPDGANWDTFGAEWTEDLAGLAEENHV